MRDARARESERVLERTKEISSAAELDAALALAGDDLVMLAIESDEECYAGRARGVVRMRKWRRASN